MHDEGTKSGVKIFANIFISFIGAGILGLPYAFKEAGLVEGIVIMISIGVISVKAMMLVIDCKDKILLQSSLGINGTEKGTQKNGGQTPGHVLDYGDVGHAAMGVGGRYLVDASIIISQIGFCCAYLIFITENLYSVLPRIPLLGYLFIILVLQTFFSNLRQLKSLAPFSLFADFATVFAYSIVFYFDMRHFHLIQFHITNYSWEGLPFFLGVAIYCFEGAGLILSLEASAAKEIRGSFKRIFKLAITTTTLLYILFGVCGYLSFGPDTESIITLNLPAGLFPFLVKGALCCSLFFTYPVMMFPVSKILERKLCSNSTDSTTSFLLGSVLRTGLVFLSGLVVILVPDFSILMALVGSCCCTLLAFILPAVFHWRIFREELKWSNKAFNMFLICLGLIGAVIGTSDALSRMYGDKTTEKLPDLGNATMSALTAATRATTPLG